MACHRDHQLSLLPRLSRPAILAALELFLALTLCFVRNLVIFLITVLRFPPHPRNSLGSPGAVGRGRRRCKLIAGAMGRVHETLLKSRRCIVFFFYGIPLAAQTGKLGGNLDLHAFRALCLEGIITPFVLYFFLSWFRPVTTALPCPELLSREELGDVVPPPWMRLHSMHGQSCAGLGVLVVILFSHFHLGLGIGFLFL